MLNPCLDQWIEYIYYTYFLKCFHSPLSHALFLLFFMMLEFDEAGLIGIYFPQLKASVHYSQLLFCTYMNVNQNSLCSKDNVIKFIFTFTHQCMGIVLELYCTQSSIQSRNTINLIYSMTTSRLLQQSVSTRAVVPTQGYKDIWGYLAFPPGVPEKTHETIG